MKPISKALKQTFLLSGIITLTAVISGCASISEDQCAAGNWLERGYKDGLKGYSSSRISEYADVCSKHGFSISSATYLRGHRDGVEQYCTYENGFARGEDGLAFNKVCAGGIGDGYAAGYDGGRQRYAIYQEHKSLISNYESKRETLSGIRSRLDEPGLMAMDKKRLRKKERRIEDDLEDIRIEIRALERYYNLSRYSF